MKLAGTHLETLFDGAVVSEQCGGVSRRCIQTGNEEMFFVQMPYICKYVSSWLTAVPALALEEKYTMK